MAPHPTRFVLVSHDGSTRAIDRQRKSLLHTYIDIVELLGNPKLAPVVRAAGDGLTMVYRDPKDASFEPINPLAYHSFGAAVRGPVAVLGSDDSLDAFVQRPIDMSLPQRIF